MAGATGGMTILPQFQGDAYTLQNKAALAQALMQQSFQPQNTQAVGSGQYTVVPKYSGLGGLAQLGQALVAARMQNDVAQGYGQLGQAQGNYLMGTPTTTQPPQTTGGVSASAGLGGAGVTPDSLANVLGSQSQNGYASPTTQRTGGILSPGGALNPNGMDPLAALQLYMDPEGKKELFKSVTANYAPTQATLAARQAGEDPRLWNVQQHQKDAYIPMVSGTGIFRNGLTGQPVAYNPEMPAGTTPLFDASGNVAAVNPINGAQGAMRGNAAANAGGSAQYQTQEVWDPNANGGSGGYVRQTVSNVADAANGVPGFSPFQNAVRQTESGGRPDAINPASGAAGSMQVTPNGAGSPNPGFGVRPAANNSPAELQRVGADYANAMQKKYGNDADAAVAYNWGPANADKWIAAGRPWKMLPDETKAYVGQVMTQQQNYAGKPQGQAGPMASQPPMGVQKATDTSQNAPSQQMASTYQAMSGMDSNYQQSRESLNEMLALAKSKGTTGAIAGVLPQGVSTRISPDAAKYEKAHATYVDLQGKGLGSGSTDAARANISSSVPTYDKPQSAMVSGLQDKLNNLDLAHLKTQFLNPVFNKGDQTAFTQQSAAFDQNIKPSMAPILQMSGPTQQAAVKAAVEANPALKPNFKWAFDNGFLK